MKHFKKAFNTTLGIIAGLLAGQVIATMVNKIIPTDSDNEVESKSNSETTE